jgi:maltose-binding protein MalE
LKSLAEVGMSGEVFPTNPEATVIWNSSKKALDAIFFQNANVEAKLKEFADKVKSDIAKMKK